MKAGCYYANIFKRITSRQSSRLSNRTEKRPKSSFAYFIEGKTAKRTKLYNILLSSFNLIKMLIFALATSIYMDLSLCYGCGTKFGCRFSQFMVFFLLIKQFIHIYNLILLSMVFSRLFVAKVLNRKNGNWL